MCDEKQWTIKWNVYATDACVEGALRVTYIIEIRFDHVQNLLIHLFVVVLLQLL